MNILITGANGYIGQRLIEALLGTGHRLFCCVRDRSRFFPGHALPDLSVLELDFTCPGEASLPPDLDVAFYLIHSLSSNDPKFEDQELACADNFNRLTAGTSLRQVIYLGGIVNEAGLSRHLSSRLRVESRLRMGKAPLTVLRAGIIVGSGSASFEIIRDLVEKLPVMITPKWLMTKCQPIAIRNVIQYLTGVLLREDTYGQEFDIGGTEILTYKQMLLDFAAVRGLKRYIITVPVMTPKLSSYWLYFVTATSWRLARNLVESMKVNVVCKDNRLQQMLGIRPLSYTESIRLAFQRIEQNMVVSSWKDAFSGSAISPRLTNYINLPVHGCFKDVKVRQVQGDEGMVLHRLWRIGGDSGWYYGNWLWKLRGWMDKMAGGVGLRRGRTHADTLNPGDALDFWRVLVADKDAQRLLLYAEMKLPGEAWLEFNIHRVAGVSWLSQVAVFRPRGLLGRLYWYSVLPFHYFIFNGLINRLVRTIDPPSRL